MMLLSNWPCSDRDERAAFLDLLLARCGDYRRASLTLTAIHPDGQHWRPSRHIPIEDRQSINTALQQLDSANVEGWGAYFAVGLRRAGLDRGHRGRVEDVVALPALYVDIDEHSADVLLRLNAAQPTPSCLIDSGGGYHAYWWLEKPTADFAGARQILRGLAAAFDGDPLSVAQSMRLVGSLNTKPERNGAHCHLLELTDDRYSLRDFAPLMPQPPPERRRKQQCLSSNSSLANLKSRIATDLINLGYIRRGDWLNGHCLLPHRHKHFDHHPSFGFNLRTGYGHCYVCGTLSARDVGEALAVLLTDRKFRS